MSQKMKRLFLCLPIIMLFAFAVPAVSLAQESNPGQDQPTFIESVWQAAASTFNKALDWTVQAFNKVVAWVVEQGSQIAQALAFWRDNNQLAVVESPPAEPQVLGEEADNNQTSIINNQKNTNNQLSRQSSDQPTTNNQQPISETNIAPPPPSLPTQTEQPAVETPAEPVPVAPITTPEIIIEPEKAEAQPAKQNSSYFIPILARDTLPPSSSITAMSTSTSAAFTVAWTGQDSDITGNPSVSNFDIQYQVDRGAWTDWLSRTTLLSDLFTNAQDEKIYGFRSRSRDRYDNLETYPDSADTSTYANLSVPVTPAVTSHTNGGTVLSTTADEDTSSGSTVQVTLVGTGEASNVVTLTLSQTSTTATTSVSLLGNWSKQFTLAEGANNFTLQTQESDGDNSLSASFVLNLEMVPTREVVINEIAWMGSATDTGDEWIELYNASSTAINLANWTLVSADGSPSITISSGTIAAKSYFLMERFDDTTVFDVTADFVYSGSGTTNQMGNGGEQLTLRDSTSKLIDKVGSSTVAWFAGSNTTKATMERKDPAGDGTSSSNWANNDGTLVNGKASDNSTALTATPKSLNSVNTTIPRVVTDLQMQFIYTTTTSVRLYWTTPKTANLATTTVATYDIRYLAVASCPITETNWASATAATGEPTPSTTQGTAATSTASGLSSNTSYCFGIKTNNGSNDSGISNSYTATTEDGNYTTLAGYPVGGIIASSTSPYIITADITIPASGSLVIQPGAVVKMSGVRNIILSASSTLTIGSASDSINAAVITSKDDNTFSTPASGSDGTPGAGDWNRITMSSGSISMNNGIVRYGGNAAGMVQMTGGSASITRSILEWSNNYAITLGNDSTALTLSNSTIQNNNEGIGISTSANATISGTTLTGNHRGIAIGTTADEANLSITGNNFYANNRVFGATVFAGIHYSDTTGTLTAENNWWGSASGPTTTSPDGDDTTDAAMADTTAVIDYTPFATSVFTVLPSNL